MRQRNLRTTALLSLTAVLCMAGFSSDHPDEPCATCHEDVLAGSVRHEPAARGECGACHDADTRELTLPRAELCLTCHVEVRPEDARSPHDFFEQGRCEVCHLDHASEAVHLLLADPLTICESCHAEQAGRRSHPVGGGIIDPRSGGQLTCTSTCHDPHAAKYPHLLHDDDDRRLCRSCHEDKF